MRRITVVFCTDRSMLLPLRVAAATLCEHLSEAVELDLHVCGHELNEDDVGSLRRSLIQRRPHVSVRLHDLDLQPYRRLPSLRGSRVPYALLHVPQMVEADRILYLDADTLVLIDVSQLLDVPLNGHVLGAVGWRTVAREALEWPWYERVGLPPDTAVFNSGVVLIDRAKWLQEDVTERCLSLGRDHPHLLRTADQSVLNGALRGSFCTLDARYNVRLGPRSKSYHGSGIVHFVGSTKPWDIGARWTHDNYALWRSTARRMGERSFVAPDLRRWLSRLGAGARRAWPG